MDSRRHPRRWLGYVCAAAIVGVCTLLSGLSHWWELTEANVVMIFLAGVALTAARFGHGPALAAIGLSVLAFDFFFVEPIFAITPVDAQYFITLGVMVAIGLVISELTFRLQRELGASQSRERRSTQMYRMTRELGTVAGRQQLLTTAGVVLADAFDGDIVIFLRDSGGAIALRYGESSALARDPTTAVAADWAAHRGRLAGFGGEAVAGSPALFAPMTGLVQSIGVVGVRPRQADRFLDVEERRLLETCANLIALSLERDQSMLDAQDAQMQVTTEQLRNSLLTSISHDLRTPLATIAVTTSGLLDGATEQTLADKREVLETIVDQTRQLGRQVDNLLDLGRLNSSEAPLECEWQVIEELVGVALARLRRELAGHTVKIDIPADAPMLWVTGDLMGQVLINLLENAVRYTPAGSRIEISARRRGEGVELTVADNGPGLPAGSEEAMFEKFARGPTKVADGRRGLGLGLAICRSIVRAHGGEITARNRASGGAEFVVAMPCRSESPAIRLDGPSEERVASKRG
jgi:two-component system sensor histidine kinase KdpD